MRASRKLAYDDPSNPHVSKVSAELDQRHRESHQTEILSPKDAKIRNRENNAGYLRHRSAEEIRSRVDTGARNRDLRIYLRSCHDVRNRLNRLRNPERW